MGLIMVGIFIIQVTFWDLIAYSAAGVVWTLKLRRACTICDGPAGDRVVRYDSSLLVLNSYLTFSWGPRDLLGSLKI
jgi:hypothetical protein